jgi:circadian clock protein KaiC
MSLRKKATMTRAEPGNPPALVATGIAGLDTILQGGLPGHRLYLVQGHPGSGKTTLALQFLLEGRRRGETGLLVTLSETKNELREVAASHGWSLDGLAVHELPAFEDQAFAGSEYTLFHPSEMELRESTQSLFEAVKRIQPVRLVLDSLSEMRLLAQDPLRYRRQIAALKQFFVGRQCTVLLVDDLTAAADLQLQTMAHGVIHLEQTVPPYGRERRRLQVVKLRGVSYRGGYHDFTITRGGLIVYPRLAAVEHPPTFAPAKISSGLVSLDTLMGGEVQSGTTLLLMGPAGSGKSVLATQYVAAAVNRGDKAAMYLFDEGIATSLVRAAGLGIELQRFRESGQVIMQQVDPVEMSPGEFVHAICHAVQHERTRIVVIDSLNGYLMSLPRDGGLMGQLHELFTFLRMQGVLTLVVVAQHGLVGSTVETPVDLSYLADTVMMLRYFEAMGEVRQAISVLKKRTGIHERTIREFRIGNGGLYVGEPLKDFQGVLSGIPTYCGSEAPLLGDGHAGA